MEISTGVKVDELNNNSESMLFFYNVIEWEVHFQGFEGCGNSPQEAVDDMISDLEDYRIVQYLNGYVLEETEGGEDE